MSLASMLTEFSSAREQMGGSTGPVPRPTVLGLVYRLEEVATRAVYAENEEGGKARSAIAHVARTLGVDIASGPGEMWSRERMQRVTDGAKAVVDELENLRLTTAEDKRHLDRPAAEITALRREHAKAMGDAGYWRCMALTEAAEADGSDTLRATIVRQATEITALKGERV